jgi:hypothetical protein
VLESQAPIKRDSSADVGRISVRVNSNSYLTAAFIGTFFSAFLLYLGYNAAAAVLVAIFWLAIPLLAYFEKVVFDGRRLTRVGPAAVMQSWLIDSRRRLRVSAVEHVETHPVRTIKRGNKIYPSYRTVISGRGTQFVLASTTKNYRKLLRALLPLVSEEVLDHRSVEMRDYLIEPKEVRMFWRTHSPSIARVKPRRRRPK